MLFFTADLILQSVNQCSEVDSDCMLLQCELVILFAHLFNIDQAFSDGGFCTNAHLLKHVVLLKPEVVQTGFVVSVPLYTVKAMSELLKPPGTESKQARRIEHNKTSAHFFCLIFRVNLNEYSLGGITLN